MSRARFGHLCNTSRGLVLIQRLPKSQAGAMQEENILFQHEVKEYLFDSGFGETDRFFLAGGRPYHKVGEDIFIAAAAFDVRGADFTNREDFLAIVAELAKMHRILEDVKFSAKPQRRMQAAAPDKACEVLAGYRKKLMKAGKFSEFDMLFLKAFEKFEPKMAAWAGFPKDILGNNKYICHNLLKEENIYMGDRPIFTNFGMAGHGHYLHDLVYIVKRYLKIQPQGDLPLGDILKAYETHHPMQDFDIDFFAAMLSYPDKFVKLTNDYYSKKRSFAPKTYLARMEECLTRGQALEDYLRNEG
jgi:spore coat protein I